VTLKDYKSLVTRDAENRATQEFSSLKDLIGKNNNEQRKELTVFEEFQEKKAVFLEKER
jgi:hypothetical protein